MLFDDRVFQVVELGTVQEFVVPTKVQAWHRDSRWQWTRSPTDQDVSGTLFLILQLADVKVRIVHGLE